MMKQTLLATLVAASLMACSKPMPVAETKPALDVAVVRPQEVKLPQAMPAFGVIAPWQELSLGAEVGGMRLTTLLVEVGDTVRKGQVIARFNTETVQAEIEAQQASLIEAEANAENAAAQAARAQKLREADGLSEQDLQQAQTAEKTALARVGLMRAQLSSLHIKRGYAELRAPYDGIISARTGIPGQIVPAGAELVKLIRQGRLEWRAEMGVNQLAEIQVGQTVRVHLPKGDVEGTVRKVAPSVDASTRTGLVYVDLPEGTQSPAGAYMSGEIYGAEGPAMLIPAAAVVLRDGKQQVVVVGADSKVQFQPVTARPAGKDKNRVEGLRPDQQIVQTGGSFLSAGDLVRVVPAPVPATGQ